MDLNEKLIEQITRIVVEQLKQNKKPTKISSVEMIDGYVETGIAVKGRNPKEVVIGVGPCFGKFVRNTIAGISHVEVLKQLLAGIEEEGMKPRVVRVVKTSDVAFIGKEAAMLSGSGISVGIQSKGTTLIHQKDLYPLTNLELFPQAPLITLEMYRAIGKNAAKYAKGVSVIPIPVQSDFMSRPKYQVKAAIMHIKETEHVIKNGNSIEIEREEL
ncbi:propanediol/glycerol family dehydratase medium subunit [Clostridium estertheticum]|uniref:propanediol/glycerol family dehydratase medium subunit n=1 Tax=Clostridium estertheticum TaxID=238834 RepID=UPI0013E96CFF|nr:propanediol/glycerol family dehydratase medium subunit [Clostridium estertheticum]MBZ9686044.1 propanediol/glycerol family dehydratase medium subunit [Clostridium estertheticum]